MPVLFDEDAEGIVNGDLPGIFTSINDTNLLTVNAANKKNGTQCLKIASGLRANKNVGANYSELYCGQWFKHEQARSTDYNIGEFLSATDVAYSLVLFNNGSIGVWRGGVFVTSAATGLMTTNTYVYLEFQLKLHASAGKAVVWVDGVKVIDYTGDVTGISEIRKYQWRSDSGMTLFVDDLKISTERVFDPLAVVTVQNNVRGMKLSMGLGL